MKCCTSDHTAVDDLGVYQAIVYYGMGFQKCGAILSDVFDFSKLVSRAIEIKGVVVKCTLILHFCLLH